ncbi:MAG: DUF1573 domain-containing protein [Ginsengibacter sp.]
MKKIFTGLCGIAFAFTGIAQTQTISPVHNATAQTTVIPATEATKTDTETISLQESEFNFGKIPQGKPVTHIFEFTNTGTVPLSLDNVQASCGCTTPEWNKDVVAPGATSKITVGYNAQNEGPFAKPVTITYNGNQVKQIIIKGEVWKTPVTSAPENTSVNSLKNEQ